MRLATSLLTAFSVLAFASVHAEDAKQQAPAAGAGGSMTDPVKKQTFSALDRDNDGTLSMMEAAADPDAKQQFKQLDKNNDYQLSRSEYEARDKRTAGEAATGATR